MIIKKPEINIKVDFDDVLTSDSCAQLIMELVKYILYQKQQVPFSCDTLAKLYKSSKETEQNVKPMKIILDSLNRVLEQLSLQLSIDHSNVKEIIIAIGTTIINSKLYIRFELPSGILNSRKHNMNHENAYRKSLLVLMRSVFNCTQFQQYMTEPMEITNTFVLVKKNDSSSLLNFLTKLDFKPSMHTATSFRVQFNHNDSYKLNCTCLNMVNIYRDSMGDNDIDIEDSDKLNENNEEDSYHWHKMQEVIRGFQYHK